MKFLIDDNPISYDEIHGSIRQYMDENDGKPPSYILVNPETRRKIIIASHDVERGMQYTMVHFQPTKKVGELKRVEEIFGLYLLRSEDVEPGFMIICG